MKNIKMGAVALLVLISQLSVAQFNSLDTDSLNWEASIDMYNLIKTGSGTVMLKKMSPKGGAYRAALTGNIYKLTHELLKDTTGNQQYGKFTENARNVGISVGYEWRKSSQRHQLYYGADLGFTHSSHRYDYSQGWHGNRFSPTIGYTYAIQPFAGIKYRVHKHVSISAECNFSLRYLFVKNLQFDSDAIVDKGKTIGLEFTPLRFINISYHF